MRDLISRRSVLAGTAGLAAGALTRRATAAEDQSADQMLQELIQENQESSLDSGFDNASRNVRLPKKTLPTLSPSTAQTTEESVAKYEAIVAKGGWPEVPAIADGLRERGGAGAAPAHCGRG
jgi:hypothetical protein